MPRVSVIIPTFNCARYIVEAVESAVRQTYKDVEVIVVDDGSTDDTRGRLAPYLDAGTIRYITQDNAGPSAARNTGIRAATGTYLAFLDADDSIAPASLEKRAKFLDDHPDTDVVFTDCFIHEVEGRAESDRPHLRDYGFLRRVAPAIASARGADILFNGGFFEAFFRERICTLTGNLMVRRARDESVELFDESLACGDITEYWFRLCRKHRVGFIDEPLFSYNRYRSSLTRDHFEGVPSYIKVESALAQDLRASGAEWQPLIAVINRRISNYHFGLGCYRFDQGASALAREHFRRGIRFNPRNIKCYLYWLLCSLPRTPITQLRRVKRRIGSRYLGAPQSGSKV